jgi:putative membrane protein insertion efficiency factor
MRIKNWFIDKLRNIYILPIKLYQLILSPFFGRNCIYHPTCSNYAIQAIRKKGIFLGTIIGSYRILRCNPWGKGGYDPVDREDKNILNN